MFNFCIRICTLTLVQSICRPAERLQKNIWQLRQWYSVSQDHITIWELIWYPLHCTVHHWGDGYSKLILKVLKFKIWDSIDVMIATCLLNKVLVVCPDLNISGYQMLISIQTKPLGRQQLISTYHNPALKRITPPAIIQQRPTMPPI